MAKSENGENMAVDTLANLFAPDMSKFIVEAGPNNTKETLGSLYRIAVPKSFVTKDGVTVDMVGNANEYRAWLSNNWNGSRHGFKDLDVAAKLARAADPASNGFEPSEPAVQSPVELAIQNIVAKRNPSSVAGLTDAQISRSPDMQKAIATILNDPARTETYRPLIEAELEAMRSWSIQRTRKGEASGSEESKLDF
jgi:hypothetical protein